MKNSSAPIVQSKYEIVRHQEGSSYHSYLHIIKQHTSRFFLELSVVLFIIYAHC